MTNLKSSINKVGNKVSQVIHFSNGEEKTFENIDPKTIKTGSFTKFWAGDKYVAVNQKEVLWFETHKE